MQILAHARTTSCALRSASCASSLSNNWRRTISEGTQNRFEPTFIFVRVPQCLAYAGIRAHRSHLYQKALAKIKEQKQKEQQDIIDRDIERRFLRFMVRQRARIILSSCNTGF
jgi:hypothetical protein